ncbi:5977_t:CDS:2 [Dentiscutata erythropus]|uniref:5977_t:CDS:1 n=1 Tax=Dentiscutata erythropus TaxID=1348616 RepID=A0A9N9DWR0_9GLOM|nr:5977_t:CDS:2 [Dentiscutata erythropus]
MSGNQNLISYSDDENNFVIIGNSGAQRSRRRSRNNYRKSICWKYFHPFKVPKDGSETRCNFNGCNTKYVWRGSTSNLVRHLKREHQITTKSSVLTTSIQSPSTYDDFQLKINLPLIKFIVSSASPFNITDSLKSSGLINLQIELPLEEQINKVYDRLFLQLKSKAQQANSVMLSIDYPYIEDIEEITPVITCCWLTEDFEFNKILLCIVKKWNDSGIIEALDQWELTNLKFIYNFYDELDEDSFYDGFTLDDMLEEKYQDIIHIIHKNKIRSGDCLIRDNLTIWAEKSISTQEISNIITAVQNATLNLCDVAKELRNERMQRVMNIPINDIQNAEKFYCDCHYHKIEFLSSIEQSFKLLLNYSNHNDEFIRGNITKFKNLLLDNLPFSIFPKLLRLFEPLKHIGNVSTRNIADMLTNAINILNEISSQLTLSQFNLEHEVLESFLIFLIHSYLHEIVGLFLDPRSRPIVTLHETLKEFILNKCEAYYSQIASSFGNTLNKSIQDLASEELERYISLPQFLFNENFDLYKWWKDSKHIFPGLATLAREYLLLLSDNEIPLNNLEKFRRVYQDEETINKIAFLDCNLKYFTF